MSFVCLSHSTRVYDFNPEPTQVTRYILVQIYTLDQSGVS